MHHKLLTCLCVMLFAQATPAHFLFVRILPPAEGGRAAEVMFSDRPDAGDAMFVDKIVGTKLWLQTEAGQFQPLASVKTTDRLRAVLPGDPTLALIGEFTYGVLARPKQPAFLLRHYPKAVAGDPKKLHSFSLKKDVPLEIRADFADDLVTFTALRDGQPIPAIELTLLGTSPKSTKMTTDKQGQATWKPTQGNFAIYLGETRKAEGTHDGKKYEQIREFASLSFSWPMIHTKADPEALKMFQEAIAQRASWTSFPGFTAKATAYVDARSWTGAIGVAADGTADVNTSEETVGPWIKDQLDSIVMHRLAPPKSSAAPVVWFGDAGDHPLGRLIVFEGGKFASSYRVKDKQLMTVNRHLGKSTMTIAILENDKNAEGKILPRSYAVQYWDAATGQIKRTETIHQRWQRIEGIDLPIEHTQATSTQGNLVVRTVRLSDIKVGKK